MTRGTVSVAELIEQHAQRFADAHLVFGHGTDNAWDEATWLVLHVTGLPDDTATLPQAVPEAARGRIDALAQARIDERKPMAYLLGTARLAGFEFAVMPGIVVPRSPLAQLLAQEEVPGLVQAPATILDLCTGSGCLGIIAAHAFADAEVTLVDLDPAAVALARRNVAQHDLDARVRVLHGDLYAALADPTRFDLIVSNPPYVLPQDMAALPPEYRHEPVLGLLGGGTGLDVAQRLVQGARAHLTGTGLLLGEVGRSAPQLQRRFPALPFVWLDLPHGGEGVFTLTAQALAAASADPG